jgi:hypothetical protein
MTAFSNARKWPLEWRRPQTLNLPPASALQDFDLDFHCRAEIIA